MALTSGLVLLACSRAPKQKKAARELAIEPAAPSRAPTPSVEQRLPKQPGGLSWLLFGGGTDPLSNQISIAQDLELASSLFAGEGLTLFASGAGAQVAVERASKSDIASPAADAVFERLAALLGPPGAQQVSYRDSKLQIAAPATRDHVLDALRSALDATRGEDAGTAASAAPLLVIAAGHGERGTLARENSLALWGGWSVSVEDVAQALEAPEHVRPTRFVITACYGGGFAELAFVHADPQAGTRAPDHCGLFAAPADDESSGCDPNPDRRQQESYTMHFLNALRGQDRDGRERLRELDLDRDSHVSLREAHAWARIHSHSFDIPTSTSERYLREHARSLEHDRGLRSEPELDLEEHAVVSALAEELELPSEQSAREKLHELDRILEEAAALVDDAQHGSDDSFYALRIALLERWPLLDHAWDPRAHALAEREALPILALLDDSELAQGNAAAARELDEALVQHDAVRVARARVLRLVRAYETLRLSSALKRRGGPRFEHYAALRECERFVPALRAPVADVAGGSAASDAVEAEAHAK